MIYGSDLYRNDVNKIVFILHAQQDSDAEADIPMSRHCHTVIAMGNAFKAVKDASDYITDSTSNDGLYHAFQNFGLI